jgi:hypothetical protein
MSGRLNVRWVKLAAATAVMMLIAAQRAPATPVTTGLVLELRGGAGVTADGGNLVSTWADQSSAGNSVAQATAANQPLLVTGVTNGTQTFDVIRFDGATDVLSRTSGVANMPTSATGGMIFLVYRTSVSGATFQNVYGIGVGTDANRISTGLGVGTSWSTRTRTGTAGAAGSTSSVSAAEAGGVPLANTFYAQAAVWDGSGGAASQLSKLLLPSGAIVTGADTGGFPAPAFTATQLNLGMLQTTPSAGTTFQGDLAEMLVYNTALTTEQQAQVFDYLGTTYGIVPEPSSVILSLCGLVGAAVMARRKWR